MRSFTMYRIGLLLLVVILGGCRTEPARPAKQVSLAQLEKETRHLVFFRFIGSDDDFDYFATPEGKHYKVSLAEIDDPRSFPLDTDIAVLVTVKDGKITVPDPHKMAAMSQDELLRTGYNNDQPYPRTMNIFWHFFGDAPLAVQALGLLQLAFTVWMLADAYQRRVEYFWYWAIFVFQPLGPWIYFFVIKFRTMRLFRTRGLSLPEPKLSLDELRYRVGRSPTVANRLALAERLMDKKLHQDAIPLLEAILLVEPNYCPALHALGECRLATGAADAAVAPLTKLIEREPRWSGYRARRTLIEVHRARGQAADVLKACRDLEKVSPTLENKCLLAEQLIETGLGTEAGQVLDRALEDYSYLPWTKRWQHRRWAREARQLLETAEQANGAQPAGTASGQGSPGTCNQNVRE